jgi:4-hydroxy-3-polyprenylbenzoate decarboxylase
LSQRGRVLVAITGASGVVYAVRLISVLRRMGVLEAVIHSRSSILSARSEGIELERFLEALKLQGVRVYGENDIAAPYASSSSAPDAMVVIPCSVKTLASIAYGIADNLITRAALSVLRLSRKLILVPRETPLGRAEIKAMLEAAENGAIILPASPAFYVKPRHLSDIVNFIVGKVLDVLGYQHSLYPRWSGKLEGYSSSSSPR